MKRLYSRTFINAICHESETFQQQLRELEQELNGEVAEVEFDFKDGLFIVRVDTNRRDLDHIKTRYAELEQVVENVVDASEKVTLEAAQVVNG